MSIIGVEAIGHPIYLKTAEPYFEKHGLHSYCIADHNPSGAIHGKLNFAYIKIVGISL